MNDRELILAGIDMKDLMNRLMNNGSLVKIFVKKFVEDKNYEKLVTAIAAGDHAGAESASHTLKGMCGNLSLKELYGLFTEQVRLIRAGEHAAAADMMPAITSAYKNAVGHINNYLAG